ncbi:MAG: MOSC domain-containing protein [Elusimicrobia bacterium]|nr:MOSC domain-containing protein [Elusimicrobiota bacterium]
MSGRIVSISVSGERGTKKKPVQRAYFRKDYGIDGDAHAGTDRQVSFLTKGSIDRMREKGVKITPGDFAENLVIEGLEFKEIKIKDRYVLNGEVLVEVSAIGKTCHSRCSIYRLAGECVMPEEGVFARVVKGGTAAVGNPVTKEG